MNKFSFFLIIFISLKSFLIFFSSQLFSHELSPNIINIQIEKTRISIEFTTNLEAYLAGVDFSILDNTNDEEVSNDKNINSVCAICVSANNQPYC